MLVLVAIVSNLVLAIEPPSLIFWDEQVYNAAAAMILHGQSCPTIGIAVGQSTDFIATVCNYEHPPLVKVLVAVTLYIFGPLKDAGAPGSLVSHVAAFLSLRAVQLTMGALSLPLTYTIAYDVSNDRR